MRRTDEKGKARALFTASELQESVREAIDRVQFGGEQLVITRWGRPAAMLVPLSPADVAKYVPGEAA